MKKYYLLLMGLLLCLTTWAESVSQEEARQKAMQFLNQQPSSPKKGTKMRTPVKTDKLSLAKDADGYYVFNIGQKEGFVLVSAEDRAPAILGYADEGTFNQENIPENLRVWLQSYADQLEWLKQHPQKSFRAPALDEHASIAPLLTCTWNQGAPYNNLCPLDNGQRSVTGCVATAMAQILYYHKYPAKTTAEIPAYTTYDKNIKVSSIGITTINWKYMKDNYTGNESAIQKTAVAKLMQLCGSSVYMDYTSNQSGASSSNVPEAFKNYFGYDAGTYLADRGDFRAREWNNLIYNELVSNRPVYYSGSSTGGGHAFVIDGYSKDGLFHVNWGWGGSCNGYFLLSILDPDSNSGIGASSSTDGYSFYQDAMIGAQPNTGVALQKEVKMTTYDIMLAEDSVFTLTNNAYSILFTVETYNQTGETQHFEIGLGIFDTDEQLVYAEANNDVTLDAGWGWNALDVGADSIPALPNGNYSICVLSREYGSDTWLKNVNSEKYYLQAKVTDGTMTLQPPRIDLSGIIKVSGSMEKGSRLTTTTTIQNKGTFFRDQLFLTVNGKSVGGQYFEVETGKSDVVEMSFTPDTIGSTHIAIGYISYHYVDNQGWQEEFHEIASTDATVIAAKSYSLSFSNGQILNADSEGNIIGKAPIIQVDITNNKPYAYNDDIKTWVWKAMEDDNWSYVTNFDTPISIGAGETRTTNIEVDSLQNGTYWFIIVYKNEGEFTSYNDKNVCYRDLYGYTVNVEGNSPETEPEPEPGQMGSGTLDDPYTVADAIAVTSALEANQLSSEQYYIQGIISRIKYEYSEKFGTAVFFISDDGTTDNEFQIYNAYFLENKAWTEDNTQIKVGDEVLMCGKIVNYRGTTPEMAEKAGYIYSLNGRTTDTQELILADGTYYFRNIASGKFWGAANRWGTEASLVDEYQYATLTNFGDNTYSLMSMVSNGGNAVYFNGEFMDNASPVALTFRKAGKGIVTIANGDNYYGYDGTSTVLGKNLSANDENAFWEILTEEDVLAEQQAILASATADQPVDATFLIKDAQFGRNRIDLWDAWVMGNCNNYHFGGPNSDVANYCAESYHSTFFLQQSLSDTPKGVYKLQAQGFFRQDGTDKVNLPYFYLLTLSPTEEGGTAWAEDTAPFPLLTGKDNSMEDAGNSFLKGEYLCAPMYAEIHDGDELLVGAYLDDNVSLWCIWDNFKLTYYGPDANLNELKNSALIASYEEALAAATALLTDESYTIVTGFERDSLSNVIREYSTVEHTTEALTEAIDILSSWATQFKLAKVAYEKLRNLQLLAGTFKYASAEKAAAVETHKDYKPTSGADAESKYEEWIPDFRRYAESSAMLESINTASDQTSLIMNPNAQGGDGWFVVIGENSPGGMSILANEPLTDGFGNFNYAYFDGGAWAYSAWDVGLVQDVLIPAGKYQLTVASRAAAGLNSFTLFADESMTEMTHIGATGGLFGNGWNDASLEFELDHQKTVTIGVRGVTEHAQNWMSFTRFRLFCFTTPVPTGITELTGDQTSKGIYNLRGQKMTKAQKGLYIINGKKAVMK